MKNHASKGKSLSIKQGSDELDAHVVEAISLDSSESQNESKKSINNESQGNLGPILTRLLELEEKTRNESSERALFIDKNQKKGRRDKPVEINCYHIKRRQPPSLDSS